MIKEIIINEDELCDEQISEKREINKIIIIGENRLFLKNHNNTYYFLDDDDINEMGKLFLIKKEYIKDYPFIGENTLNITNYFIAGSFNDDVAGEWIDFADVNKIVGSSIYDNPRNSKNTDELLEIIKLVLNYK